MVDLDEIVARVAHCRARTDGLAALVERALVQLKQAEDDQAAAEAELERAIRVAGSAFSSNLVERAVEIKEQAFRAAVERLGSVRAAAAELGMKPSTANDYARKLGIKSTGKGERGSRQ